jgi:hypothetical protein
MIAQLQTKLKSFDVSAIIADILKDKRIGFIIISTIQDRLENEGRDANNQTLRTDIGQSSKGTGIYARNTVTFKRAKGQPIDRVTLKDTGEFYRSFRSQFRGNELGLTANFRNIYENFQDSFANEKEFTQAILDLTDDELQRIFDNYIYPQIEEKTLKYFGLF